MVFTLVKSKGCLLPISVHLFANTARAFTSIGFTFFMTDVSAAHYKYPYSSTRGVFRRCHHGGHALFLRLKKTERIGKQVNIIGDAIGRTGDRARGALRRRRAIRRRYSLFICE